MSAESSRLNALDLCEVTQRMRERPNVIRDRKFHGVIYPACFVGSDAVAWLK
ncbi:MAG: hypothetical protein FJY56_20985, partial [Betaproteobacteria bacterium]|nr:hypothetical protein [Betaproteobacteria bacterium]